MCAVGEKQRFTVCKDTFWKVFNPKHLCLHLRTVHHPPYCLMVEWLSNREERGGGRNSSSKLHKRLPCFWCSTPPTTAAAVACAIQMRCADVRKRPHCACVRRTQRNTIKHIHTSVSPQLYYFLRFCRSGCSQLWFGSRHLPSNNPHRLYYVSVLMNQCFYSNAHDSRGRQYCPRAGSQQIKKFIYHLMII